ncbi:MAG: 50S ribosome-binding GTPase [Lachnospiraceae bacterium]|nr:50S ribosome-binding GTPase [Lachnospiraceae bacterium]
MEDVRLLDFRSKLCHIQEALNETLEPYAENLNVLKHVSNIKGIYQTKIDATNPEIMVYGIYNAGKSSIINELIGSDAAKVADVPTTDSVDYYEWNGYKIADTPGVGAPIQHEEVTQNHLKNADVVIFVMSTTGSNERKENYVRMKDIADSGKKIIIVLNDKNGDLGTNDDVINQIKIKVGWNMKTVGIEDVDKKYCIVVVNAQRARQGRIRNIPKLYEKSNMQELSTIIRHELKKAGSFAILSSAVVNVEKEIESIISVLENMNGGSKDSLNILLNRIREEKQIIRETMSAFIDRKTRTLSMELPAEFSNVLSNNVDEETNNKCITAILERKCSSLAEEVQKRLDQEIRGLIETLCQEIDDLPVVDRENISAVIPVLNFEKITSEEYSFNSAQDDFKDSSSGNSFCFNTLQYEAGKKIMGEAVGAIAQTAVGKALAKTTVGKFVASVMPVVGPVIEVALFVLPILKGLFGDDGGYERALAKAERENEIARQQALAAAQAKQEMIQKCLYLSVEFGEDLKDSVNASINNVSNNLSKPFTMKKKDDQSKEEQNKVALIKLDKIIDACHLLRQELSASQE